MPWIEARPDGVRVRLRLKPRASRDRIEGLKDEELVVRLCAPPVENQANLSLVELLARTLRVPRSSVALVAGEKSKSKVVAIQGLSPEEIEARLLKKD